MLVQVDNLHLRAGYELSEGLPVLREPALPASEGRMPRALPASSERRAGCPTRTSGDGAWAALSDAMDRHRLTTCATRRRNGQTQVDNLCYGAMRSACRAQPQPHVPPPHAAVRAASRRSMASDVGVIESPPSAVQRSSRGICSATRLAVATTSSNGIT